MKTKYYLRGLATGLVIATVLMSFTAAGKRAVSDEEIKERAMQLGMVMPGGNTTLADGRKPQQQTESDGETEGTGESMEPGDTGESRDPAETPENGETGETQGGGETEGTGESMESGDTGESQDPAETPENGETGEPQEGGETEGTGEDQNPGNGEGIGDAAGIVTVVIYSGYGSNDVARALKNAGLVEDAEDFDEFLCANGYDKRISADVYRIPVGSGYEEIARIITKRG